MLPGSFVQRSRKCGKPICRCAGGEKLHAQFLLSVLVESQPQSFHVPAARADEVRGKAEQRKRFAEAAAQIAHLNSRRFLGREERKQRCAATSSQPVSTS